MKRALAFTIAIALVNLPPVLAADGQQAMQSFLTYAIGAAAQQFRNVGVPFGPGGRLDLPDAATRIFGKGIGRCELWQRGDLPGVYHHPDRRLKLLCGPAVPGLFASPNSYVAAVRSAMPHGFTNVACPAETEKAYQHFIRCYRRSDATEIDLLNEETNTFDLYVVAPEPQIDRSSRRLALRPLLAAISGAAVSDFPGSDTAGFAKRYSALVYPCTVAMHPSGRRVLSCSMRNGEFSSATDFTSAIAAALPTGFHASSCVQYGLEEQTCARNRRGVEVGMSTAWPYSLTADNASLSDRRAAKMRSFFAVTLPAAAKKFAGYDSHRILPYFGRCDVKQSHEREYLNCSMEMSNGFEGGGNDNDYGAVVRAALPARYAENGCMLNVADLGYEYAGSFCFGAPGRPEVEIGRDDAGDWVMFVIVP